MPIPKDRRGLGPVEVRGGRPQDLDGIYHVAASLSRGARESARGFLIADYAAYPDYYKKRFAALIEKISHFYVAEEVVEGGNKRLVGFLAAYTKEMWLEDNPHWIKDIFWHPAFDRERLADFMLVDTTAVLSHLTGRGIGSQLYKVLTAAMKQEGVTTLFGETIIDPIPNFASLAFRKKQEYTLAGVRYEEYLGKVYTNLVYCKDVL